MLIDQLQTNMVILEKIIFFWEKIKRLGFGDDQEENSVISLMNQMSIIGGIGCMIMVVVSLIIGSSAFYSFLALIFGLNILLPAVLNYYKQISLSKLLIAGVHPTLISLYIIVCGGSVGEESILIVSLFMIYILYSDKPKAMLQFYILAGVAYVCAEVYLFFLPPIFKIADNPYDNFIAFLTCSTWLYMIIWLYQRKVAAQKEDQEKLIEELQIKNGSLKKTTEELEQFTYIASHDLKSPLRTIISFLDLIKRDVTREKYDDLLSKVDFARSGAEQMNYLVTDILEYSKMTNGGKRKKKITSLQSLADKVRFNLMDLIEKRNVDLYIFPLPDFYCNETEMTVLFQNFIENGIKYNEEATPNIFVKSKQEGNQLILQFIDNGIGIEEQYFDKIFLFFKRLHTSENYKGTGLGLGLCKKIIDDMKGTVSVESTINVGSTFTVRLPIEESAEQGIFNRTLSERYN